MYPSSGKLVVGLRVAKAADTDPGAGKWVYLSGMVQADADGRAIRLSNVGVMTDDEGLAPLIDPIAAQLGSKVNVDYGIAYDNLLNAANAKLNRPLKDGFRMEGNLSSAKLENVSFARRWGHDRTSRQWRPEDPVRHVSRDHRRKLWIAAVDLTSFGPDA